jgi:hypothetical protein
MRRAAATDHTARNRRDRVFILLEALLPRIAYRVASHVADQAVWSEGYPDGHLSLHTP